MYAGIENRDIMRWDKAMPGINGIGTLWLSNVSSDTGQNMTKSFNHVIEICVHMYIYVNIYEKKVFLFLLCFALLDFVSFISGDSIHFEYEKSFWILVYKGSNLLRLTKHIPAHARTHTIHTDLVMLDSFKTHPFAISNEQRYIKKCLRK